MPTDRKRYHPKWSLISRLIRFHRAKNHCEVCGAKNYSVGHWEHSRWVPLCGNVEADDYGAGVFSYKQAAAFAREYNEFVAEGNPDIYKLRVIKLGVAHLDHNEQNNDFKNLMAMCQRCHLQHDKQDNWQRRLYGPNGKFYGQTILFGEQPQISATAHRRTKKARRRPPAATHGGMAAG